MKRAFLLLALAGCASDPGDVTAGLGSTSCGLPLAPASVQLGAPRGQACPELHSIAPPADFVLVRWDAVDTTACEASRVLERPTDRATWNLYTWEVAPGSYAGEVVYAGCEYPFESDPQ